MQRVTISLDEALAPAIDHLAKEQGYQNRSEAVRDPVRQAVEAKQLEATSGTGFAAQGPQSIWSGR